MLKTRLIPVVLVKNGHVVQSKGFTRHQVLGNPSTIVWRLSNWFSDELIYLDISRELKLGNKRSDLNYKYKTNIGEIIQEVAKKCFMPLTLGGGIRTIEDIRLRLSSGADKVSINSQAIENPDFISEAVQLFGSQCIVISMDAKRSESGWELYTQYGKKPTGKEIVNWAMEMQDRGAGEILLNSIDNDGKGKGYDTGLVSQVVDAVKIPVVALGGCGSWEHLSQCIEKANPSAIAAANIFQYSESSVYNAKKTLYDKGFDVREPTVQTIINEGGL